GTSHGFHHPVDRRIAPTAALVDWPAAVADAGNDKAVVDTAKPLFVSSKPAKRPDRAGSEEEPVSEPVAPPREHPGKECENGKARAIVVGKRRVANMGAEQHLALRHAGQEDLAIGEHPIGKGGIDENVVFPLLRSEER